MGYFNPRIPCGMRLHVITSFVYDNKISIHASHAGCDNWLQIVAFRHTYNFNPRIPCGMRPAAGKRFQCCIYNFNPRIPCGMRPCEVVFMPTCHNQFQSTHPMRDATSFTSPPSGYSLFQSTHPMRDATTSWG